MDKHVSTDMTDTRRAAAVDSRISYGYRSILFLFTTTTPWRTYGNVSTSACLFVSRITQNVVGGFT